MSLSAPVFKVMVIMLALATAVTAQKRSLTGDDIQAALAEGGRGKKGYNYGIVLRDSGQAWMTMGAATATTGFWVEAYTPYSWVMTLASRAALEYRTATPDSITNPETFRVIAHPDMPRQVTAAGMYGTSSVSHVVLRDDTRRIVIQPLTKETFNEDASNAFGGGAKFEGVVATFPMDGLREVRGRSGEFFITIIGATGEEKNFKVKKKHFEDLR